MKTIQTRPLSLLVRATAALSVAALLGGCAATEVALSKKDLDVQTKTSTAIFVEPVPRAQRTVYVEVRSGVMEFDRGAFLRFIKSQFATNGNGYQVVDDPDQARFQMLVYVLNLEKTSPDAAHAALQQGYVGGGELAAGAAAGALIAGHTGNSYNALGGAAAGGLLVAGAALVANSLVHDVTYMLVCDVAIREKVANGVYVRKDTQVDVKVSDAGTSQQRVSEVGDMKDYRTRIVTTAEQANLELKDAQDLMFQKTAYAMAGFF
jgi:hypothetical protein